MCIRMDTYLDRCQHHYLAAYKISDFLELDSAHLFPRTGDSFTAKETWKDVLYQWVPCSSYVPYHLEAASTVKRWNKDQTNCQLQDNCLHNWNNSSGVLAKVEQLVFQ